MADLPHFLRIRSEPGKRAAWVMAVAVHALLALFLIYGIRWQTSAPEAVSVDLVRHLPSTAADKPALPPQEQKPPEPVPKNVQKEEPPVPPKAEILRKEPEKPKIQKKVDAVSDWIKRASDSLTNRHVVDAADRAQAQIKVNQAVAARNKGLADYLAKIRGKIRGKIFLPPSINGNPESEFDVTQLPGGEVLSVKLKKSSGNPALDAAVERAILQSSPLPKPDDPSLFERQLSIKYRPQED